MGRGWEGGVWVWVRLDIILFWVSTDLIWDWLLRVRVRLNGRIEVLADREWTGKDAGLDVKKKMAHGTGRRV